MDSEQYEERLVVTLLASEAQEGVGVRWQMPVSRAFMDRSIKQELESTHVEDGAGA